MRDIEFRGIHRNKWIYGYLVKSVDDNKFYITVSTDQFYQVKEDTLGQYTGLIDKNGKRIFEGDIVIYDNDYIKQAGVIEWNNKNASFQIKGISSSSMTHLNRMIVIGNIYENREG